MLRKIGLFYLSLIIGTIAHAQDMSGREAISEADMPYMLNYSNLDNPYGWVPLSNKDIVLQQLIVPGKTWEGVHSHPGHQMFVHIKGGYWTGKMGEEVMYSHELSPAGEMGWMGHIPLDDRHDSGNTGDEPIELIYITSKRGIPLTPETEEVATVYPNIALDVKLEDELMLAQRGTINPGEWTGVHDRPGNQLYILVKGGTLSERDASGSESSVTQVDGAAKWLDAANGINLGNTGDTPIDYVLVTFK